MSEFEVSRRSLLALSPRRNSAHPQWQRPQAQDPKPGKQEHQMGQDVKKQQFS